MVENTRSLQRASSLRSAVSEGASARGVRFADVEEVMEETPTPSGPEMLGVNDGRVGSSLDTSRAQMLPQFARASELQPGIRTLGGFAATSSMAQSSDGSAESNTVISGGSRSSMGLSGRSSAAMSRLMAKLKTGSVVFDYLDRKVSFAVQVVVLMLIPMGFLVGFSIVNFQVGLAEHDAVGTFGGMFPLLGECETGLMAERAWSSQVVVERLLEERAASGTRRRAAAATAIAQYTTRNDAARALVDAHCSGTIDFAVALLGDGAQAELRERWAAQFRASIRGVVQTRVTVDGQTKGTMTPTALRAVYTAAIAQMGASRAVLQVVMSDFENGAELVAEHRQQWVLYSMLNLCRAAAGELISLRGLPAVNDTASADYREFHAANVELREAFDWYAAVRDEYGWLKQDVPEPVAVSGGQLALEAEMEGLLAAPHGHPLDLDKMFAEFDAVATQVDPVAARLDSHALALLVGEASKLAAALLSAIVCMAAIIHAQTRASRRLNLALRVSRDTQRAVLKFVPRNFLRMAGCNSILHITPGEHTEVAVAMLFSDIRRFTSIGERMTNTELFDWLQGYFGRMTAVTESNKGFVDQFIGDAVFAVFAAPSDAVACAVAMQANVTQLNADIVAAGGEYVLIVGVGVHHAVVAVGFHGDVRRLSPTMASPESQVAGRLEEATKRFGARVLVSEGAFEQLPPTAQADVAHRRMGKIHMHEGPAERVVEVFQADPLDLKQHKAATKEKFEAAVARAEGGEAKLAKVLLREVTSAAQVNGVVDGGAAALLSAGGMYSAPPQTNVFPRVSPTASGTSMPTGVAPEPGAVDPTWSPPGGAQVLVHPTNLASSSNPPALCVLPPNVPTGSLGADDWSSSAQKRKERNAVRMALAGDDTAAMSHSGSTAPLASDAARLVSPPSPELILRDGDQQRPMNSAADGRLSASVLKHQNSISASALPPSVGGALLPPDPEKMAIASLLSLPPESA